MNISQQYTDLLPKLSRVLSKITKILQDNFTDGFKIETDLKTEKSVIRKCKDKKCKDITELADLIRGRLYFPSNYNYNQVLQQLIDIFGHNIHKIDWKKSRDYGLEYHGIVHVDIGIDNVYFELQVIPLGFRPFIEPQHKIYEILRDGTDIDENIKKHLIKLHNKMFSALEYKHI